VTRLIRLLQERREFASAEIIFRRFEEQAPLSPDLARLGAELALANNQVKRALALAKQAIPEGSRDYRDYLWLAVLYQADDNFDMANEALGYALSYAPHTPETWVAVVQHLASSGRVAEVPRVLGGSREEDAPQSFAVHAGPLP